MSQYQQQQNANTSTSTSSSGSDVEHDDLQETMGNAAIQEMLNGNSIDPDSVFASAFHNNQERVQNSKKGPKSPINEVFGI